MDDLDAIGLLQDPLRRRLYDYVVAQRREVTRAEASEATGVQRTNVAFHLDRLVEGGLLKVDQRRVNGRSGPGAGRPAKLYRRSDIEHRVSLPARDYRLAAELLADAAETVRLDTALFDAARARGRADRAAAPADIDEWELLEARGYELYCDGDEVRMGNCPFHSLAETQPAITCGMNLALLEGLLEDSDRWDVALDARVGSECCAVLLSKSNVS